jgi:hypothetical protein
MGKNTHQRRNMMRITALISILCIGFLAWYSYPKPPPDIDSKLPAPSLAPAESITNEAKPERVAVLEDPCPVVDRSRDWEDVKAIFPGMSDAELCEFIVAPDYTKFASMEVNRGAAQAMLNRFLAAGDDNEDYMAVVPDLRYYLDPQAIELMRGFSEGELIDKINNERSAEAAYWLALHYQEDEQTYVALMLNAASYAQKPGPLFEAINGCCSYSLDDPASKRAADIKREALVMIARELNLPDAARWPEFELDPDIEAEVLAQRAVYVEQINQYSVQAFGEDWVK